MRIEKENLRVLAIKTIERLNLTQREMMNITYGVTEEIYALTDNSRKSYGIAVYSDPQNDGTATVIASVKDITSDKNKLDELVKQCNLLKLSPIHLSDVIDDFLAD